MSILIVVIIVFFILLNILYKKTNAYQNQEFYFRKFKDGVPNDLEVVNVGSGPSYYAIDYNLLSVKGFNFAIPPQSAYHDLALLKHYKNNIKKGAIIIIGVTCPLIFAKNRRSRTKVSRCRYYRTLDAKEVYGGSKVEAFLYCYFPLVLYPKRIIRLVKDIPIEDDSEKEINLEDDAKHMMEGWMVNNCVSDLKDASQARLHQDDFARVVEIYRNMLQLCKEQGWKTCFVIPPVSKPIRRLVSQEFKKVFVTDNMDKSNIYDIPILDYFSDDRIADDKYFLNSMFLNENGRKEFMKILWNDINYELINKQRD